MTRINLVDPSMLTNEHLMAEYRELPRIFTAVRKLYDSGKTIADVKGIPTEYVLGAGHCKFFYNKLDWLTIRFMDLAHVLIKQRNFDIDIDKYESIYDSAIKLVQDVTLRGEMVSYKPTPEEIYKNMYRISVRHFKTEDVVFE